jgi:hypothetical protein
MIFAAQTRPEDATSNIAAWLHWLGIDRVPNILASASVDWWGTILGAITVLYTVWWALRAERKRQVINAVRKIFRRGGQPPVSTPLSVEAGPKWIPLSEALHYLVYASRWGASQSAVAGENEFNDLISAEVREHLARGDILSRGKRGWGPEARKRATEEISKEFWIDAFILNCLCSKTAATS